MAEKIVHPRKSLQSDLKDALNWVESLGVRIEGTRFAKYSKNLALLENSINVPDRLGSEAFDSAIEAWELVLIHKGLSQHKSEAFRARLSELSGGPLHSGDEKPDGSSHKARNTGLELAVGAHFALAGFSVDFDTKADIIASDPRTTFYVECKRPSSFKISNTIDEAYSQLKARYIGHSLEREPRGLAVISLNKLLNPESLQLRVQSTREAVSTVDSEVNRFLNGNERLWYNDLDERTMAVMAYATWAVFVEGQKGLYILRHFGGKYVSNTHDRMLVHQDPDRVYFSLVLFELNTAVQRAFEGGMFKNG